MQVIYQDENEKSDCREADLVDIVIYIEKISRYLEGKYIRRFRSRVIGI